MADDRYAGTLASLEVFCSAHGYRWRWKTERASERQWKGTVRLIDPTKEEYRDRVRAYISSTGHDELFALGNAIRYAIAAARERLEVDARYGVGDALGKLGHAD